MVKHRHQGEEWWCLPGGRIEAGETPEQAALRELREECRVEGTIIRPTSKLNYYPETDSLYIDLSELPSENIVSVPRSCYTL